MALNHLVFTDHGTFRVKADKLTPSNDMLSLYAEGKLVASFNKDRVIGVGLERNLPDYSGAKLKVVGQASKPVSTNSKIPSEAAPEAANTPLASQEDQDSDNYLP